MKNASEWPFQSPWSLNSGHPSHTSCIMGAQLAPKTAPWSPNSPHPSRTSRPYGPTRAIRWRSRRLKGASIRHTPHALRALGPSADPSDGSSELKLGTPLRHFVIHGPPKALSWTPRPPNPQGTPRLPDETLQRLVPDPFEATAPDTN